MVKDKTSVSVGTVDRKCHQMWNTSLLRLSKIMVEIGVYFYLVRRSHIYYVTTKETVKGGTKLFLVILN